jgi:excisionase family DNA binding protein
MPRSSHTHLTDDYHIGSIFMTTNMVMIDMAYPPHRSDLISARVGPLGDLTLFRKINGQTWTRKVRLQGLLTPMETAVVLRAHRVTVYEWIRNGVIPAKDGPDGFLLRWRDVRKFGRERGLLT